MTLIVAGIHDDHIAMVADTKITFPDRVKGVDEQRTRRVFDEPLAKIVIVRDDLAVGVAGEDPHRVIENLVADRRAAVDDVLALLASTPETAFVVASKNPLQLWEIKSGAVEDVTARCRGWAGSHDGYEAFQRAMLDPQIASDHVCVKLMKSMQHLTSFGYIDAVGGTTFKVKLFPEGFRHVPLFSWVGPHYLEVESVRLLDGKLLVTMVVPDGVDGSIYQVIVVPGTDPTPEAVGLLIPQAGRGLIWTKDEPWKEVVVAAGSVEEFVATALSETGTSLLAFDAPDVSTGPFRITRL